jgi:hypothetical protein
MLGIAVGVAKIEVPQINRQRHCGAQNADGIALIDRKVTKHEEAPESAAFPKAEWDYTFPSPFRGDPLDQEAQAKNQAAAQSDDFPRVNQDPEHMRFGEKLETVHNAPRFLQGAAVYKLPSFFPLRWNPAKIPPHVIDLGAGQPATS